MAWRSAIGQIVRVRSLRNDRAAMAFRDVSYQLYAAGRAAVMPDLRNSQYAYADALRRELTGARCWLDLGCGHEHLPPWFAPEERRLDLTDRMAIGVDLDEAALRRHRGLTGRLRADIEQLPFAANTFDLITANMVVEHVRCPSALFTEINRVLQPGGRLLIHTPNRHGYSTTAARVLPPSIKVFLAKHLNQREADDVYPTFYRANTPRGLRDAAHRAGLITEDIDLVLSSPLCASFAPLMLPELLWIRALATPALSAFRPCIIAVFAKPTAGHKTRERPVAIR